MTLGNTRILRKFMILMLAFLMVFASTVMVFADAEDELESSVASDVQSKFYATSGGGNISGSTIYYLDTTTHEYTVNTENFNKLTSAAKDQFVKDIANAGQKKVETDKAATGSPNQVTQETYQGWLTKLSENSGLGQQMMITLTGNMKPDFYGAQQFMRPLSGPLGTALGIFVWILFAGLALKIVMDLCYIGIPAFRLVFSGSGDKGSNYNSTNGKGLAGAAVAVKNSMISKEAVRAANEEQTTSKALWSWFTGQILMFILLAFIMFYLVSGQIFGFIGSIVDLFSGLTGI